MPITKRAQAYIRNTVLAREQSLEHRRLQALGLRPAKHATTPSPHSSLMGKRGHSESSDEEEGDFSYLSDAVQIVSSHEDVDSRGRPSRSFKIRWATTWEASEDMEESVPQLVKEYEREKPNRIVKVIGPQPRSLSQKVSEAPFLVERANGKKAVVEFAMLREKYPDALIDYFWSCRVIGGTPRQNGDKKDDKKVDDIEKENEDTGAAVENLVQNMMDTICGDLTL
uniref:ChSh domain-containing protein n=1 Tax=Steinernema glaseri TaxID=37863 RepID=A0A1I7YA43_9BILA